MILKACLNGGRTRSEHPAVPVTAEELARAGRDAVQAGAEALHIHPRARSGRRSGRETLLAEDIEAAVVAVRRHCPGIPLGVSTGLWIAGGDAGRRLDQVAGWPRLPSVSRPDFASVNLSEPGARELIAVLGEAGIAVEAGVWSVPDAEAVAELDLRPVSGAGPGLLRILVEIIDTPPDLAVQTADQILATLPRATSGEVEILLHGEEAACWPVLRHARALGLSTRIGLEDVLTGPDGEPVRSNADLVRLAARQN